MSGNTGYAIRHDDSGCTGIGVRRAGSGWKVEVLERGTLAEGLPGHYGQTVGSGAATWLLNEDEAGLAHLTMPKLRTAALQKAFAGGLARDHGGTPDDWFTSWRATGEASQNGHTPYVLHLASREIVDGARDRAATWGVDLDRMLPAHLALDLFYRAHGPAHDTHDVWNLVFVGRDEHFLCVSTREAQLLVRNLPANLAADGDSTEHLERLAREVERSVFFARQTEASPEVECVIVCGDPEVAGPLVEAIKATTSLPALHWEIERSLKWDVADHQPDDLLAVAGAALAAESIPFNLLPEGGRWQLPRGVRRKLAVAGTACAAGVVPLLAVGGLLTSHIQDGYLARAHQRLDEARVTARQAEDAYAAQRLLLAREDRIRAFVGTRPDFEAVLLNLADLAPNEVVFRDLTAREEADGTFALRLRGASRAGSGARAHGAFLEFLAALDGSALIARRGEPRVMRIKPGLDEAADEKLTEFDLDLVWRGPGRKGS